MRKVSTHLLRLHRWLGLIVALFWVCQAVTGLILAFHWEWDDATVVGVHRPTDIAAIERSVAAMAGTGARVANLSTTAGAVDRYDLEIERAPGETSFVRIDGVGDMLRTRPTDAGWFDGGIFDKIAALHVELLSGDIGAIIVGTSGFLLVSNLVMGLLIVLCGPLRLRRALRPAMTGNRLTRLLGWHRALGLWGSIPALVLVSAGVLMAFSDPITRLIGVSRMAEPKLAARAGQPSIGLAKAVSVAMRGYPGATLAGVRFPDGEKPWRIRLHQPDEWLRAYGRTTIFVDPQDGHVLIDVDPHQQTIGRRFFDNLFAVHTGEAGGLAGRMIVFATGLWLLAMIGLGIWLWRARRPLRKGGRA